MGAPEKQVGEFTCPDFTEDPEPALRTKCQELAPCVIHRSRRQEPTGIWDRACLTSTCTLLYNSDSALFCFIDLHFAKIITLIKIGLAHVVFRHSLSNRLIQGVQVRANLPPHRSRAQANTSLQVACINGTAPEAIFYSLVNATLARVLSNPIQSSENLPAHLAIAKQIFKSPLNRFAAAAVTRLQQTLRKCQISKRIEQLSGISDCST